jgi:pimeloyl-ACP methyl ester carboxylesterase
VFDLQHQYEHKIAYLRQRLEANPQLQFVIISHSIGSYLHLKVMEAFPAHIAKAVFMQPTFHRIGDSDKGVAMRPLFCHHAHAAQLVKAIAFLTPMWLRRWLASRAVGAVDEAVFVELSVALVKHHVMSNVLHMDAQEMQQVGDVDAVTLRQHEHKALFVYSPYDGWVPNAFVQMFQLAFPLARHRVVPQGHGFMVEPNGSRDMADHIAQWVADALAGASE